MYWAIPEIIGYPGGREGQESLEIQVGGGFRLENSSSGVIFDRCLKIEFSS